MPAARDGEGIVRQVYVPEEDQKKGISGDKELPLHHKCKGRNHLISMENLTSHSHLWISRKAKTSSSLLMLDDLTDAGININVQISNMIHMETLKAQLALHDW